MKAIECLQQIHADTSRFQHLVNAFIDEFRHASPPERALLVADPILESGPYEGLLAGVVSALCRETETPGPAWLETISSPEPFFAFPAKSFALRVRLMFESPAPFRIRNVFVPANYLSRA